MRQSVSILILMFAFQISFSQKKERFTFSYNEEKLDKVLAYAGNIFGIQYSYADSIVAPKTITVSKKYDLEEFNAEIERQTLLTIVKIDERYYSIYQRPDVAHEQIEEILIEGFLSKGIHKSNQRFIISPQKVEELPGVTDADILLSLQQLPGVKSPNETASGLHVRGGTPDQNLILWDGIRMYHPGHLFGMISGFNPNVDQKVYYYNKATNPRFGERISSVIDIKSSDKISDSLSVAAGINALNADIYLRTPLVKDKLGLQLSGRKSFTEWIQSPTFNSLAEKVFQNTHFKEFDDKNRFQFQDYSAKLNFTPVEGTELSLTGIIIDNFLDFSTIGDLSEPRNQKMTILNHGYSFNWNQKYTNRLSQHALVYYSAYTLDYAKNQQYSADEFDTFTKANRITDSGIELNFVYAANSKLNFEFGYQLFGNDISHSFKSRNENFEIGLDQKHLYNVTHAGYSYLKYHLHTWNFQAGGRFNYFTSLKEHSLEPRLFVKKKLSKTFTWHLSYEKKSQVMSQVRESVANDLSLENYVWILADGTEYPIQRANQYTTGLIFKTKSWLVDVDAYYKAIEGVTSLSFGFLHQYDSEVHNGEGFTNGLDILIQKSAPTWRAWLTYSYQDSQNRYDGINGNEYFPINADTKHAVTLSAHKKWGKFSAALGWLWHTGKPYSVLNGFNDIASFNSERLPDYHRMDLSATYQFRDSKSWRGKFGLSVLNLYDRHSVINKEYERQYATIGEAVNSSYKVQDYYSLGITPNVFVRVNF